MQRKKVFISSVQSEFAAERQMLFDYLTTDALLARPMYLYGSIEQVGTGTEMIVEKCIAQGLRIPDFEQDESFLMTFWRKEEEENSEKKIIENRETGGQDLEKGTEKITNNQQKIIDTISKKPHITSEELSVIIGIRADKVRINLSTLKTKGFIERIGSDKGGYWKIKNN